jgi:hypothetical protein
MNCERFRTLFVEEWAGALAASDGERLAAHLADCASCREEREALNGLWRELASMPSEEAPPGVRARFYAMLDGYQEAAGSVRDGAVRHAGLRESLGFWLGARRALQFAIGAALLVGGFASGYILRAGRNGQGELASLREEVQEMRQMVTIALLKQRSASDRLKGVSWSSEVSRPDPEFLSTLVHTLNFDSNVDVRLAAVDALSRFAGDAALRGELIRSLPRQESPLVQISLIDLLVQLHERQSIDVLRSLTNDANQDEQVRERARWGLRELS